MERLSFKNSSSSLIRYIYQIGFDKFNLGNLHMREPYLYGKVSTGIKRKKGYYSLWLLIVIIVVAVICFRVIR